MGSRNVIRWKMEFQAREAGECQVLSWQKAGEIIQNKKYRIRAFIYSEFRGIYMLKTIEVSLSIIILFSTINITLQIVTEFFKIVLINNYRLYLIYVLLLE